MVKKCVIVYGGNGGEKERERGGRGNGGNMKSPRHTYNHIYNQNSILAAEIRN